MGDHTEAEPTLSETIAAIREATPGPTVEPNSQDWAGMDGTTAYLLIQRHADNWADVGRMMGEWLEANRATQASAPADAQQRCPHCDDTGDVSSITGEWRGVCSCAAGDRFRAPAVVSQQLPSEAAGDKPSPTEAAGATTPRTIQITEAQLAEQIEKGFMAGAEHAMKNIAPQALLALNAKLAAGAAPPAQNQSTGTKE